MTFVAEVSHAHGRDPRAAGVGMNRDYIQRNAAQMAALLADLD